MSCHFVPLLRIEWSFLLRTPQQRLPVLCNEPHMRCKGFTVTHNMQSKSRSCARKLVNERARDKKRKNDGWPAVMWATVNFVFPSLVTSFDFHRLPYTNRSQSCRMDSLSVYRYNASATSSRKVATRRTSNITPWWWVQVHDTKTVMPNSRKKQSG